MGYNPNIPQSGDFISVSQKEIFANFNTVQQVFEKNHFSLTDDNVSNRGKHKRVGFAEQGSDPTTSSNVISVYTKDVSGTPEIYARNESSGTVFRWTKRGRISPALSLEAFVIFDVDGNILKNPNGEDLSYNVSSITIPNPLSNSKNIIDDWVVNFTNNISTDKYFWNISGTYARPDFSAADKFASTTPFNSGTYSTSVTASMLRVKTKNQNGNVRRLTSVVYVQVYTVA